MLCLVVLGLFAAVNSLPTVYQFNQWKLAHGKVYRPDEEMKRMQIFMDNLKFIEEYNAREDRYMTLGLNDFSDLTHEEFKAMMTGSVNQTAEIKAWLDKEASTFITPANFEAPEDSVDWRSKGAVTPIKNQGQCGSCYSFSAIGSLEGQAFLKSKKLESLSEQQVLDCSGSYGNYGCQGGYMTNSFKYIKDAGGSDTEAGYPYEGVQRTCRFKSNYIGAKVTGFVEVEKGSEAKLKDAVASKGPIAIAIDASHRSFQMYRTGIYYEPACSTTHLSHAVLVVGYATDKWDYWLVKNSWGTGWGDRGYIKMLRNYNNMCGIASLASYPLV